MISRQRKKSIRSGQKMMVYIVVTALILFYGIFVFFPMIYALVGSFFNWNIARGTFTFNGLDNYISIFSAPKFRAGIINSVIFSVIATILRCFLGMVIAVMIYFSSQKLKEFYRTAFFLPIVISMVAASYVWKWFFDAQNGIFNWLLSVIGVSGPNWLNDSSFALPAIIIMTVWKDVGFAVVLYLAGMLMYSKEANNRKQEIDRQHHTIPNQRANDKHHGNVYNLLFRYGKVRSQNMEKLKSSFPTFCKRTFPQLHKIASYAHYAQCRLLRKPSHFIIYSRK